MGYDERLNEFLNEMAELLAEHYLREINNITDKEKKMGALQVIDETGDTKLMWTIGNQDEMEAAKELFKKLKKKKYIAYSVDEDGDKKEIIHEFDPNLGRIIMIPPIVGG